MTLSESSVSFEVRTYNLVPQRSAIFYFCARGDLVAMQELFQSGRAGLLDVREKIVKFGTRDSHYEDLLAVNSLITLQFTEPNLHSVPRLLDIYTSVGTF